MIIVLPMPQPFAGSAVAVVKENAADVAAVLAMRLLQAILMLTAVTWPIAAVIPAEAPQFWASWGVLTLMPMTLPEVALPSVRPHKVTATFEFTATLADAVRVNDVVNDVLAGMLEVAVRKPAEVLTTPGAEASIKKFNGYVMVTLSPLLRALCKENDTTTFRFVLDAIRSAIAMSIFTLDTWPPRMPADALVPVRSVVVVMNTSRVPWLG